MASLLLFISHDHRDHVSNSPKTIALINERVAVKRASIHARLLILREIGQRDFERKRSNEWNEQTAVIRKGDKDRCEKEEAMFCVPTKVRLSGTSSGRIIEILQSDAVSQRLSATAMLLLALKASEFAPHSGLLQRNS